MKNSFQKIKKGTSHYIQIMHWSHNIYPLLYTQTEGTTTIYDKQSTLLNIFS